MSAGEVADRTGVGVRVRRAACDDGAASLSTIAIDVEAIKLFDSGASTDVKNQGILDRQTQIYDTTAEQKLYDDAYAAAFLRKVKEIMGDGNGIFPIHRSVRFVLLTATAGSPTTQTACRFGVSRVEDLDAGVRGLPQRLGERGARPGGALLLAAASAVVTFGPEGEVPVLELGGLFLGELRRVRRTDEQHERVPVELHAAN